MKPPLFVRPLTDIERAAVLKGLRSSDAFTLRRCQIIFASMRGEHAAMIGLQLGCSDQTVRNAVRAFNQRGTAALSRRSSRPVTMYPAFDGAGVERLCALLRRPPRDFGKDADSWTLSLIAEVSFAEGLTAERISGETVRATLARSGVRWRRAKRWFVTPDQPYPRKKEAPGP